MVTKNKTSKTKTEMEKKQVGKDKKAEKSKAVPAKIGESETGNKFGNKTKMSAKNIAYFKNLIEKKRNKLLDELGYMQKTSLGNNIKDESGDLSSYSYHMADQASDALEKEQNFHFAQREGDFLHHLNEAMYRIKMGTYGICRTCNKLISKERLEAVPHTTMCIACKSADQERKRKAL